MKRYLIITVLFTSMVCIFLYACNNTESEHTQTSSTMDSAQFVKRGAYLVSIMGCDDCHSPKKFGPHGPELEMDLRFSGYPAKRPLAPVDSNTLKNGWMMFAPDLTAAVGPWGISFAANISSDSTGIGNWSLEQFTRALREGKSKGLENTRPLLPPMPWENFKNLTDEDLKSIYSYLKSTKPVNNAVPAPKQLAQLK